jgi:nitronate monooxygenase
MFGLDKPIISAPMGGGPSTPELVAAVSNAGGLGSLAVAYQNPGQIAAEIRRTRELTNRPFALNLFAGGMNPLDRPVEPMLEILRPIHRKFQIDPPVVPAVAGHDFEEQFKAVIAARPQFFSFTFGIPSREMMARLRSEGIVTMGTATSYAEAVLLKEAGVDAVIAQGEQAGAHRGTFTEFSEKTLVPTLDLVQQIAPLAPVVASGGIMDARDVSAMLAAGAFAVQMGTAFLTCPESGVSPVYRQALLSADADATVITRAYSGRPARGLRNYFIELAERDQSAILPYPWQNALTRPMRTAAGKLGDPGYLSLWAGRGVTRCRALPAADLVHELTR